MNTARIILHPVEHVGKLKGTMLLKIRYTMLSKVGRSTKYRNIGLLKLEPSYFFIVSSFRFIETTLSSGSSVSSTALIEFNMLANLSVFSKRFSLLLSGMC